MLYAIFSDVHANLEAFEAVLHDAQEQGANKFISLGDIIGYGPNPNECVELTKKFACVSLAGNHDWMALHPQEIKNLNLYAQYSLLWSIKKLTPDSLDYLHGLPLMDKVNNLYLVHASPYQPTKWDYILTRENAKFNFQYFDKQICLVGHSHIPKVIIQKEQTYFVHPDSKITIEKETRYIINVGSVGQPRDGNKKACYALYNILTNSFQLRRVKYQLANTQKKILLAGLPSYLSNRLDVGQ